MKRGARTLAAVALILGCVGPAKAGVINFDDISGFTDRANFPALGIENSYQGHTWPTEVGSLYWAVVNNSDGQFSTVKAFSGNQAGWNWNDGSDRNIIFSSLQDVQGAYFNVFMAQQDWGAATVQFQGFDENNNLIGTSAVLNLDRSNANPQWQWLSANFTGVKRLNIHSTNDRFGGDGWWAIDDLTLSPSGPAVPEPSTIALLGFGVAGLASYRWRRRKQAVPE